MSQKKIYLVGPLKSKFSKRKLPSTRDVLSVFFYQHQEKNLTVQECASNVVMDVVKIRNQSKLPSRQKKNIIVNVIKLYKMWQTLQRNRYRTNSKAQKLKENNFQYKLNDLFDIIAQSEVKNLTDEQNIFLNDQRQNRRAHIPRSSSGKSVEHIDERMEAESSELNSEKTVSERTNSSNKTYVPPPTTNSPGSGHSYYERKYAEELSMKKIDIITPDLVAALDRTRTSSRNAVHILSAAASSLGMDQSRLNLSRSSIHQKRIQVRHQLSLKIKEEICFPQHLVVHWDGKQLPSVENSQLIVEKLAVAVSGFDTNLLLGVPEIDQGTGENQVRAIFDTLQEWKLCDRVKAMCFDTTSSNTGHLNGSCTLLEKRLGRHLLHLACRHHIFEIILAAVFKTVCPVTNGPNVSMFNRFKQQWNEINKRNYKTGLQDKLVTDQLSDKKIEKIREFILHQLVIAQPRKDNRELLELSLIFFDRVPARGVCFTRPGAMHHARWLAKAIYSLKIYLLRDEFKLKTSDLNSIRNFCLFVVTFYIQAWFVAPSAIKAPQHDLTLVQRLIKYQNTNKAIADIALSKFKLHLWYLTEKLAGLSFIDDDVPIEIKLKMVEAVKNTESIDTDRPRLTISDQDLKSFESKDISDFVTSKSLIIFKQFDLDHDFLKCSPMFWNKNEGFVKGKEFLSQLKVVNDIAERGVAMIKDFNESLTKDPEQQQCVLQVAQQHRKKYPTL